MSTKIGKLDFKNLHNEEHYQFETEFIGLVNQFTPVALGVEVKYSIYIPLYANEGEALNIIRKSAITDELPEADRKRNDIINGMSNAVKSSSYHFKPELKAVATHLQILFDHHSGITSKSYDEKTGAIKSFLNELNGTYSSDIAALGLGEWVVELQSVNDGFISLKSNRYSEEAGKTQLRMKQVRVDVDNAFRDIAEHINALITINGDDTFKEFVSELNQRIVKYSNIIAQRKGRNNKSTDTTQPTPDSPTPTK